MLYAASGSRAFTYVTFPHTVSFNIVRRLVIVVSRDPLLRRVATPTIHGGYRRMCGSSAMKVDLWRLLNRFFVMAAAANFLYNLMPYVMLFLPDGRQNHTEPPSGHFPPMVHEPFSEERRIQMKNEARRMFYWGYDNYMQHAFPYDELNPINCSGRGHDWEKP